MLFQVLFVLVVSFNLEHSKEMYRLALSSNASHMCAFSDSTQTAIFTAKKCQPECAFICGQSSGCSGFNSYKRVNGNCEIFSSSEIIRFEESKDEFCSFFQATSKKATTSKDSQKMITSFDMFSSTTVGGPKVYDCTNSNPCSMETNGARFPHPNKANYVVCSWTQCYVMPCPAGTTYSDTSQTCI